LYKQIARRTIFRGRKESVITIRGARNGEEGGPYESRSGTPDLKSDEEEDKVFKSEKEETKKH